MRNMGGFCSCRINQDGENGKANGEAIHFRPFCYQAFQKNQTGSEISLFLRREEIGTMASASVRLGLDHTK